MFIREAEPIFSKPSFWPIIKSKSSTVTPDSGTHLQPFRSNRVSIPWAWAVAIPVTTNRTHAKINFSSYADNDLKTMRGKVRKQKKFTTISLSNAQHALSSSTNSQHAPERERERERETDVHVLGKQSITHGSTGDSQKLNKVWVIFWRGKKSLKGSAMLLSWQHCSFPFLQLWVGPWDK